MSDTDTLRRGPGRPPNPPAPVDLNAALADDRVQEIIRQAASSAAAAAVAQATAGLQAQLDALRSAPPVGGLSIPATEGAASLENIMRSLAAEIGNVSDANNQDKPWRKKLAPAVAEARAKAYERMIDLLDRVNDNGEQPQYFVNRVQYLGDQMVGPEYRDTSNRLRRQKIYWLGPPNEGLEPINLVATEIYAAFMQWIGGATPNLQQSPRAHGLRLIDEDGRASVPVTRATRSATTNGFNAGLRIGEEVVSDVLPAVPVHRNQRHPQKSL